MSEWVYRIVNRDGEWVKGDGYPGRKFYTRNPGGEVKRLNRITSYHAEFKPPFLVEKGFCRFALVEETDQTPRQWNAGDPEPEMLLGVALKVRDNHGDVWTYNDRNGFWYTPETKPYPWEHIARKWGPLTEVLPEKAARTILEGTE